MIYFLPASPKPRISETDALWNEAEALFRCFGGKLAGIYPFEKALKHIPAWLYGRNIEFSTNQANIVHVFSPSLRPYPFLKKLRQTTIISVASSVKGLSTRYLQKHAFIDSIVVSNRRDELVLKEAGLKNVTLIRTGIKHVGEKSQRNFEIEPFKLVMASAPWTKFQFKQKGIDLLLELTKSMPMLELTLIWRGYFYEELMKRIRQSGLERRVRVINEKVDVPAIISESHCTVLLVDDPRIIKAHPHSLIESLFVGRPILLSENIPMADVINSNEVGISVSDFSIDPLKKAVMTLIKGYDVYSSNAYRFDNAYYDWSRMIDDYKKLYEL